MIDVEKHNINAGNLKGCSDITIWDNLADGFIDTSIDAGYLMGCDDDAAGGLISAIDAADSIYFSNVFISEDTADELITTETNADNSMDCADDSVGGLIRWISISDDTADKLIAADAGDLL